MGAVVEREVAEVLRLGRIRYLDERGAVRSPDDGELAAGGRIDPAPEPVEDYGELAVVFQRVRAADRRSGKEREEIDVPALEVLRLPVGARDRAAGDCLLRTWSRA